MDNSFVRKPTQDNFVTEKVDIYKNNLLGEYDDNGNYAIAPQIVQELIELDKVRKNSYDNSMFCSGNLLGFGEIDFEVSFEKNRDSENRAKASLYVLEDVDKVNGYLQNIIKTKLADFVSDVDGFIEDAYVRFHVVSDDEDEGREKKTLDELELDDSYILAKRAYMLLLDKLSNEKMLDSYGKYFTARLTNLTKMENGFSNAVLDMFNNKYELIEDIFLKEKNYKALNELLDSCIESVSGTKESYIAEEKQFNDIMAEHLNEFTESANKLSDKAEQKAFGMLDPDDRNKMNQMNATFENSTGSNEVVFEEIDDSGRNIENEIDESFKNPVMDAVEAEPSMPFVEEKVSSEGEEEQKESEVEEEQRAESSQEVTENTNENVQNDLIKHILSMQESEQAENNYDEILPAEEEQPFADNDISEEYVKSNADFQKDRQNDRLNNITDRLSKLSEISEEVEKEDEQTNEEVEFEEETTAEKEEIKKEEIVENVQTDESSKLSKDRFSSLFNYLENKQDGQSMDDNDFTR